MAFRPQPRKGRPSRGLPRARFDVNGFVGMRDMRSPSYAPGEMAYIYNMMPEDAARPSKLQLREGFRRFKPDTDSTAARLDTTATQYKMRGSAAGYIGGVFKHVIISHQSVYTLSNVGYTRTLALSAAQLTTAGVGTQMYECCIYDGKLIVTGGSLPWMWDGTTGGGITPLTAAPVGARYPTVYAGKLFFGTGNSTTIYWSEEGDATTGYATSPYNNSWDLVQTASDPIRALVGIEDGLYYIREKGIGVIRGKVNADFRTTATQDAVSQTVGMQDFPATPVAHQNAIMFVDRARRPWLIRAGALLPLWEQMPRLWNTGGGDGGGVSPDQTPYLFDDLPREISRMPGVFQVRFAYDPMTHCHVFVFSSTTTARLFFFNATTDQLVSIWETDMGSDYYGSVDIVQYPSGGTYYIKVDGSGYVFAIERAHFTGIASLFSDETSTTVGSPVEGIIIGPPHGWDQTRELHFQQFDALVEVRDGLTVELEYVTSDAHKGSLVRTPASQTFTETVTDRAPFERRVSFGLDTLGRWLRPRLRVSCTAAITAQTGIYGYSISASPTGQSAESL